MGLVPTARRQQYRLYVSSENGLNPMRCMLCESLSFTHICPTCQNTFLTPSIYRRKIQNDIEVISFYSYNDIKDLLHTKHTDIGFYMYKIMAENSMRKFAAEFKFDNPVVSISIDDNIQSGYSHTAILNKALHSKYISPKFGILRAKERVSYSGKSREFRLFNPRRFELKDFNGDDVILVDDIVTTGLTLNAAINTLTKSNKNILFCMTLADASLN